MHLWIDERFVMQAVCHWRSLRWLMICKTLRSTFKFIMLNPVVFRRGCEPQSLAIDDG
jgi:hypothetical protein